MTSEPPWRRRLGYITEMCFEKSKGIAFTSTTVTIRSALNDASLAQLDALAAELA